MELLSRCVDQDLIPSVRSEMIGQIVTGIPSEKYYTLNTTNVLIDIVASEVRIEDELDGSEEAVEVLSTTDFLRIISR